MISINELVTILAAIGTLSLAAATSWSVFHNISKEKEERRIYYLYEKIDKLYSPLISEFYKAYAGKPDMNEVYRIAEINYVLAGPKTRAAINRSFSTFRKMNDTNRYSMQAEMISDYKSLESATRKEYEELLKEIHGKEAIEALGSSGIPTLTQ